MDLLDFSLFGGSYLFLVVGMLLAAGLVRWATRALQQTVAGAGSVPVGSGLSGATVALRLLAAVGLSSVRVVCYGPLNCYHPRRREIRLHEGTFGSTSLAATAVAAHEVGHAQQFAEGYFAARLHRIFWPACWGLLIGCLALPCLVLVGVQLPNLWLWICAVAFVSLLMQVVVQLPLEADATRRARKLVQDAGLVNTEELA